MNVNPAIAAQGENIASELKSFRSAAVTSENRATPLARSVLGGLVAGTSTVALVTSMTIATFGNPNSPAGKPIAKLSGSGDYLPGWGATRKALASIFDIFANIDVDAPVTVGEDTIGKGACRATITAFILNSEGAPKSLRALREAVSAHVKAHAAALTPDNAEAEADAKAEADALTPKAEAVPLSDMVNALIVAYGAASAEEKAEAQAGLTALFLAVDADISAAGATEEVPALQAA